MALSSTSKLKLHLGITSAAQDKFLGQLLSAVESAFKKLTDRDIEQTSYTEYYCGRNTPVLLLREYPVISITNVWLDEDGYYGSVSGSFGSSTLLTSGVDYALVKDGRAGASDTAKLLRIGGVWPGKWQYRSGVLTPRMTPGAGNIKVQSVCGYATVPEDIELAIWQICAQLKAERSTGQAIIEEHFEDYGVTLAAKAEEMWQVGSAAQLVSAYKRRTPRHEVLS